MSESRTAKRAIQLPLIGVAFLWAMMMLAQYVDLYREYQTYDKNGVLGNTGADGKANFTNFDFKAKVKTYPGANSGIYVHTTYEDKGWPSLGYECQVNGSHKDIKRTGGLYAVRDVLNTPAAPDNEWFDYRIRVEGDLAPGVTAKDLALYIIGRISSAGGSGHAIEFCGPAVEALSMEARMTLCNMSIEAGARVGLVAYDQTTERYVRGRPLAPSPEHWDAATAYWRETLHSDTDARFDQELTIQATDIRPQVTWGTSPEMVLDIDACVPDPDKEKDVNKRSAIERALLCCGGAGEFQMFQIGGERPGDGGTDGVDGGDGG